MPMMYIKRKVLIEKLKKEPEFNNVIESLERWSTTYADYYEVRLLCANKQQMVKLKKIYQKLKAIKGGKNG